MWVSRDTFVYVYVVGTKQGRVFSSLSFRSPKLCHFVTLSALPLQISWTVSGWNLAVTLLLGAFVAQLDTRSSKHVAASAKILIPAQDLRKVFLWAACSLIPDEKSSQSQVWVCKGNKPPPCSGTGVIFDSLSRGWGVQRLALGTL